MIVKCRKKGSENWVVHHCPKGIESKRGALRWARYKQRGLIGHWPVNYEYKFIK